MDQQGQVCMCFWRRRNGKTKLCKKPLRQEPPHSGSGGLCSIGNADLGVVLYILLFGIGPCRGVS